MTSIGRWAIFFITLKLIILMTNETLELELKTYRTRAT